MTEAQCTAIKVIPVCVQEAKDILVWPYSKDGEYFLKLGFYKLVGERGVPNNRLSSSHVVKRVVWKVICGLNVPSKIQKFL